MVKAAGCGQGKPEASKSLRAMVRPCRVPGQYQWQQGKMVPYCSGTFKWLLSEMLQGLSPWYVGVGEREAMS